MEINSILSSEDLHDAILRKITYAWKSRELVLEIDGYNIPSSITISDVASLAFSSTFPWGLSNYIKA